MSVLEDILTSLPAESASISNVCVGLHWTAVCSQNCGLATSLCDEGPHGHPVVRDVGLLHKKSAQELAQWALSTHLLEASLGLAAINSLLQVNPAGGTFDLDEFELIAELGAGKNIAVIGNFPFTQRLRAAARHLWVINKYPQTGELPESAVPTYLPWADIIAIAGTTLINQAFDHLMAHRARHAKVILLGASSPLSPVLFDHGVDYIFGSVVTDPQAALLSIQQGATFTHIYGVRSLTLEKSKVQL